MKKRNRPASPAAVQSVLKSGAEAINAAIAHAQDRPPPPRPQDRNTRSVDRAYLSVLPDGYMRELVRDTDDGDKEAVFELHRTLAEYLRVGKLTPFMRDLLAEMLESIAAGVPAGVAMLTKPPAGAPPQRSRNLRLYHSVADRLALIEYGEARRHEVEAELGHALPRRPTMTQLYRDAARQFGIQPAQAKRVYLKTRASLLRG